MEESIKSYSSISDGIIVENRKPKNRGRIIAIITAVVVLIAIIAGAVRHKMWLDYCDKYYYPFLERHNIDESVADNISSWGYVPYKYKEHKIQLQFHKPGKDKFTFGAALNAESHVPENCWTVSFNNYIYDYYFSGSVNSSGKVEYHLMINYYPPESQMSAGLIGCDITEDGNYIESNGSPALTANDRKVLDELLPEIRELHAEMRDNVLAGIAD